MTSQVVLAISVALCVVSTATADSEYWGHQEHQGSDGVNRNVVDENQQDARDLANSLYKFSYSLYDLITKEQHGNVFFSPLSIHSVLAMTSQGAKGETREDLKRGLSLPDKDATTRNGYKYLISHLNNMVGDNGVNVKVANKIYVGEGQSRQLDNNFVFTTRDSFHSETQKINFGDTRNARKTINTWVKDNTNGKIKDLIGPDSLSSDTKMVLVNAVYFKGVWKTQFNVTDTKPKQFFSAPDVSVEVPMMYASGDFNVQYKRDLDCLILEMPYKNDEMAMVIVLPQEMHGLAELERKLTPQRLSLLRVDPKQTINTNIHLPKFKLEESTKLNGVLSQMGMARIFQDSANFTGISRSGMKVSEVAHKSFVEVSEEGTEAAVATAAITVTLSAINIDTPLEFNCNHPFLFMVVHKKLNHILFMGRYKNPPSAQRPTTSQAHREPAQRPTTSRAHREPAQRPTTSQAHREPTQRPTTSQAHREPAQRPTMGQAQAESTMDHSQHESLQQSTNNEQQRIRTQQQNQAQKQQQQHQHQQHQHQQQQASGNYGRK